MYYSIHHYRDPKSPYQHSNLVSWLRIIFLSEDSSLWLKKFIAVIRVFKAQSAELP